MAVKKVRILVDCHYGHCNDVASINTTEIKEAKLAGLIDDHPDAVKYAEGLRAETAASEMPLVAPEPVSPETAPYAEDTHTLHGH